MVENIKEIKKLVWGKFEEYPFYNGAESCNYNKETKSFSLLEVDIDGEVITKEEAKKIVDKEIKKALKKGEVLLYICKDEGLIQFEDFWAIVKSMRLSDFIKYNDLEVEGLWIAWD